MNKARSTCCKRLPPYLVAALLCFLAGAPAHAITIEYQAADLTDTGAGDLWEYSYKVSDYTFPVDYGFQIEFDFQTYSDLQDPPPNVNSDWDPLVTQPNTGLSQDGIYDALALVATPSLGNLFVLEFIWAGSGTPGAQPFNVYDSGFNTVLTGNTVVAPSGGVPLPSTILLVVLGLLGLLAKGGRGRAS